MSVTLGNRTAPVSTPAAALAPASSTQPGLEGLSRGARGPEVKTLQEALNARGATLEADGKFGPLTEAALKKFQADAGCKGAGRVDAGTVSALKATAPATKAASTDNVTLNRSAAERARILGTTGTAGATPAMPAVPTSAAADPSRSLTFTRAQVDTVTAAVDVGIKQATEEKAVLGQAKDALRREIKALETPIKGTVATLADKAVLMGRKGQLDAIEKADGVLDLKIRGYTNAAISIGDGVITAAEAEVLQNFDTDVKKGEAGLKTAMQASSSLVDKGLQAGGRGKPSLGLRKPEAAALPTKLNPSDVELGRARIQTAVAGAKENLVVVDRARRELQDEIRSLTALKNPSVADQTMLAGRWAQYNVLDDATRHLGARIAGLEAADKAIADGVLTSDEAQSLSKRETELSAAEHKLAAKADLATELIQSGLAGGGRGSDVL